MATPAAEQLRPLAGAFLSRFFESEITTGTDDLKESFFWLLAALAVPGVFLPWMMVFDWQLIGGFKGHDALREASGAEKSFYLGYTLIASGLLTTIVWSSLLPDRRDALILGALPVSPARIVAAKLLALGGYIVLVAVSMHLLASVFFGALLSTNNGPPFFALRGMLAHFVASCAASATIALSIAGAQGLLLAAAGPRLFRRLSTILHVLVVGLVALLLALLPAMTSSVVHTVRGFGRMRQPWILETPPLWFLGLYEWVLGTSDPLLIGLARTAGAALAISAVAALVTYPLAYRRLMVSAIETTAEGRHNPVSRRLRSAVVTAAGRHPAPRACADFFTATVARVERHRFVLAIAAGVTLAWVLPGLRSGATTAAPDAALLALPLTSIMFMAVGLRIAASLPADVRAGWVFEVHGASRRHARQALERTLFLVAVVPPVVLSAPVYWWLWGIKVAAVHAAICLGLGMALVQLLIWHCNGIPCAQQWSPLRADLGRRWPLYLALFLVFTSVLPRLERVLFAHDVLALFAIAALVATAAAIRYASGRHVMVPSYDEVDPVAGVLRLH